MTRSPHHRFIETHGGLSVMKSILFLSGAALAMWAMPAMAQTQTSDSADVDITGNAEPACSLPTSWNFVSAANGANGGQFANNIWTIPPTALADASGTAVVSPGYAIRIRGAAMCNTSHEIRITSQYGGLVNATYRQSPPPALPQGFTFKRDMLYSAHWKDNNEGIINWRPQSAGDSTTHDYIVPPGNSDFDIKMSVQRDAASGPLLAGTYQDIIIVTLEVQG